MSKEKKPVSIKIVPASEVSEFQIANGEVGSAYSNAEVQLSKKLREADETEDFAQKIYLSEAEALEADIEVEEAEMTDAERKAKKRRIQSMLAKDLGVRFKDLDGLV